MRPVAQWQAIRGFDTECVAYLRDADGVLASPDVPLEVEACPYGGGPVAERWQGAIGSEGRLAWVFPHTSQLWTGLYRVTVRNGDGLVALGLLEVV